MAGETNIIVYGLEWDDEDFDVEKCRISAESGYALAQDMMGNCCKWGVHMPKDYAATTPALSRSPAPLLPRGHNSCPDSTGRTDGPAGPQSHTTVRPLRRPWVRPVRAHNRWPGSAGRPHRPPPRLLCTNIRPSPSSGGPPAPYRNSSPDCAAPPRFPAPPTSQTMPRRRHNPWAYVLPICSSFPSYPEPAHCLGNCYAHGVGVEQDYGKAREWYEMSAAQGDADGLCALGSCYYYGEGVPQDYTRAVEYFNRDYSKIPCGTWPVCYPF